MYNSFIVQKEVTMGVLRRGEIDFVATRGRYPGIQHIRLRKFLLNL